MKTPEEFTCSICGSSYVSNKTVNWVKSNEDIVAIPQFTTAWVLIEVEGVEVAICEKCYKSKSFTLGQFHDVHKEFAIEYFGDERFRDCVRSAIRHLKHQPDPDVYNLMALALERLQKNMFAEKVYSAALKIYPNNAHINHNWIVFKNSNKCIKNAK